MAFNIEPLQLPHPITQPQLDFRPLQEIGQAIGDYRQQQREARAIGQGLDLVTGQPPVTPAPAQPVPPRLADSGPVAQKIAAAAAKYGVPPNELLHLASLETSGLDQNAVSPKGATGVMQLMPATARELGANPADLDQNIDAGARYYAQLRQKYGRPELAAAAYNAGPGRVDAVLAGRAALPDETKNYVTRFAAGIGGSQPAPQAQQAAAPEPAPGLAPDFKERLQGMLAAGGGARALAMGLIQKYLAPKYTPITLPDGTVGRFDPNTGVFTPTFQSQKTVDVKKPGPYGTTLTETMQQGPNGTLTPLQVQGGSLAAAAPAAPTGIPRELLKPDPEWNDNEKQVYASAPPGTEGATAYGIKLARGQANMLTGMTLKSPWGQAAMDAAQAADPSFKPSEATARSQEYTDFYKGPTSKAVQSLNTLPLHVARAAKSVDGLPFVENAGPLNSIINSGINTYENMRQDPKLAKASTDLAAVSTELSKALRGVGALSEKEIGDWMGRAKAAQNPQAMKAVLQAFTGLAVDRMQAIQNHWDKTMGPANGKQWIDPGALDAWKAVYAWARGDLPASQLPDHEPGAAPGQATAPQLSPSQPAASANPQPATTASSPATFESGRDAYAAFKAGKLRKGDRFIVNGEPREIK